MNERDPQEADVLATPIHIYVLWHPLFTQGEDLAMDIYRWFRLDNIEGIPVFFRSRDAKPREGQDSRHPPRIRQRARINYVVPLVDAHMVADPAWREWLVGLTRPPKDSDKEASLPFDQRLFPVAMDDLAFQVPAELVRLNFVRHDITRQPKPGLDALLGVLTEVMCRDLRYRLLRDAAAPPVGEAGPPPSKIKIFLSHAKADGTDVVRRLKEYIQSQTQCETFFDETDIPSGRDFESVLEQAIRNDSAGMMVIHGSQYAERPWCRREIRQFQQPQEISCGASATARAFVIPPVVVVEDMNSGRVSRSLPELGFAPAIRWSEGAERRIVNTLLREVLLGFFHRLLIRRAARHRHMKAGDLLVNHPPDPLLVQRLIQKAKAARKDAGQNQDKAPQGCAPDPGHVYYPGYGLSHMEKTVIEATFSGIRFMTLAELDANTTSLDSLAGKVVRLSVGDASDILDGGYGDPHNQELVIRLFRPLAKAGVSILYGGRMPKAAGGLSAWETHPDTGKRFVNFTSTCVHLLVAERNHVREAAHAPPTGHGHEPRLYNMPAWPESEKVTPRLIAQWVDVCTFAPVAPGSLPATKPARPFDASSRLKPVAEPTDPAPDRSHFDSAASYLWAREEWEAKVQEAKDHNAVVAACCLTWMRHAACGETLFPNMNRHRGGDATEAVRPMAHVFIGGKLEGWSGLAPGIFEEFAAAAKQQQPIFLVGAGQGAAGAIARWLLSAVQGRADGRKPPLVRPTEFTVEACQGGARNTRLAGVFAEWRREGWLPRGQWGLKEILDAIEGVVAQARGVGSAPPDLNAVLNNGLTHEENLVLLDPDTGHGTICQWIHVGLIRTAMGRVSTRARRARPSKSP